MIKSSPVRISLLSLLTAALLLPGGLANGASSEEERAERMIEMRQSALHLLGFYMGPLGAMARGRAPMDAAVVSHNAAQIAVLAPMLEDTFKFDTSAYDLETEALDKIWDNWDDFAAKAQATGEKAALLAVAASSGDENALKAAIGAVGKTCGGCHDVYREEDDD